MNKSQLVNAVAEKVDVSKVEVKRVVDALFDLMEENLKTGDKVVVSGFGVFSVTDSPERVGRNPRTGETVKIPARKSVKFRSNMDIK